jgi:hypothetical protein
MIRRPLRHVVTVLVLLVAFAGQETWALAGTTGGLSGTVLDAGSGAPIAGAKVQISSPSNVSTGTTDAGGHFAFLTLPPDTYTVSVTKTGYQDLSVPGQSVFADTVQTVTLRFSPSLRTIAHVAATAAGSLVKSGTTSDVYSVNSTMQHASATLGGGGSLNSAYSAVASVPGAYVPMNQTGYYQTITIRGGDFDQVGYEFDGVPINRSFDNYPSGSASSLGNAEVQVYAGSSPANSESQGLAGFINQVIKTGTYPGYADAQLGVGTPTFYHRAEVEVGGSTPDRLFSYYVGVAGYNQDFRYLNNDNGSSYDNWVGAPLAPISDISYAGGTQYAMGPFNYGLLSSIAARDVVANLHMYIPHKNDSGRDDVQLLWDSESLHNLFYSTTNDITSTSGCGHATNGTQCANAIGLGTPQYLDGYQLNCQGAVGGTFSAGGLNGLGSRCVNTYYYPNSQNRTASFINCATGGAPTSACAIPNSASDTIWNDQEIVKLQYTKNFGSTAFLRLYGYTYYSDWLQNGPQSTYADYAGCCSPDYELNSHTRGGSLQFQDQLNPMNLLSVTASYVTANSTRDNNTQMVNFGGARSYAAVAVNAADPYSGYCYSAGGQLTTCAKGAGAEWATWGNLGSPNIFGPAGALPGSCPDPNVKSTKCTYLLAENGMYATYNQVVPQFFAASITDEIRPSDKWLINLGGRVDTYTYNGSNTDTGQARDFFTRAFNIDNCINNISGQPTPKVGTLGIPVTSACPTGYSAANWQNTPANFTYDIWQPRISGTYTVNPTNVVRFSYGRYDEPPNAAYEQYNTLQNDLADYDATNFYAFGRTSPGYPVAPSTSLNYDLSWEHVFKGTDMSFKITPFLRQTQNQIQNFFLDQKTAFISGLNVGDQRSQGVEFQFQKGDFARNGFAGVFSFTYTNSYIHYGTLASGAYGTTVITGTNQVISDYNAYTSACAPGGKYYGKIGYNHVPMCGTATDANGNTVQAAPCYTTAGVAVFSNCTTADVGNPYWNKSAQLQIDPGTAFPTFDIFPGGIGSGAAAYGVPYFASLILNYKHDRFTFTPSFQFEGGGKYGVPQTNPGIDPAACGAVLPGVAGANGGGRYDGLTCGQVTAIPDTYTGVFDPLGSFTQPNLIAMNAQLSYQVSPRITLNAVFANILNTCWGGTQAPWTTTNHNVCAYGAGGFAGEINPVGNTANPAGFNGSIVQPFVKYPYSPLFGPFNQNGSSTVTPFQMYFTANIRV